MTRVNNRHQRGILGSIFLGAARGVVADCLTRPLEVVYTRKVCNPINIRAESIVMGMLNGEGIKGFYRGFTPRLVSTAARQSCQWPLMVYMPEKIEEMGAGKHQARVITAIGLVFFDAILTTPLKKLEVHYMLQRKKPSMTYSRGAFLSNLTNKSVFTTTFFLSQKYFQEQYARNTQKLGALDLVKIGASSAGVLTVISSPFHMYNNVVQAHGTIPRRFITQYGVRALYRGLPLQAASLLIQNIASAVLFNHLI